MRTETTTRNLYTFDELDEKTQQQAIDGLYDINVGHEWWDCTYEDAEQVGCKILEFDIDRGSYCKLVFVHTAELAASSIIESHGPDCDTYKDAFTYLKARRALLPSDCDIHEDYDCEYDEDLETLDEGFQKMLSEDYLKILREEYEYLTTREAILETIEANEYEFTSEGVLA